jgi:hypothetical protein
MLPAGGGPDADPGPPEDGEAAEAPGTAREIAPASAIGTPGGGD